jgi:hypothetical protein
MLKKAPGPKRTGKKISFRRRNKRKWVARWKTVERVKILYIFINKPNRVEWTLNIQSIKIQVFFLSF